jgi:drug/metabolite transporter (DMT)-like permease
MAQASSRRKAKNASQTGMIPLGHDHQRMLSAIMQTWILITFCSAFLQNLRSVFQKQLKTKMGTTGATFVRFGFGVPFSLFYLGFQIFVLKDPLPAPNWAFALWEVVGAVSQIMATFILVHMFSLRNFAVGTAYSRTEPAQAALFALIFLGERVNIPTMLAISITVVGVMLISVARTDISWKSLGVSISSRTSLLGLLSGTLFGLSAVAYRSASLSLASSLEVPNYIMQASYTATVVIVLQTVIMLIWIILREPGELVKIRKAWALSLAVGFVGATGSFGWFMAMTLQQAAIVKALAQVEMLFTFASSVFIFKEQINRYEVAGCLLIVFGILALLLV